MIDMRSLRLRSGQLDINSSNCCVKEIATIVITNMSQVQAFYAGQNIFITGGTGFLGKLLTEKLLRSCPDIGTIYLLIRVKRGKSIQERIDALLLEPIFNVLRGQCPDFANKIVGVNGDISEKGLGLSAPDHQRIVDEVSVIFHLAATVRFNEKLERAVAVNVNSVKCIVDIAKACKNLKVGVYVSTAYSNCVRKSINEEIYSPPLSYEGVNKLIEDTRKRKWSEDEMTNFTKRTLGEWPNTYSFTKAIAEGVVAEYAKEIPFAVFRPSIVLSAYREPLPGWVSGVTGVAGMLCAIGVGMMHVQLVDLDIILDIVPVDYLCNALISCAWETTTTDRRCDENIPVYNYVSGNDNPVILKDFTRRCGTFTRVFPTEAAIYYLSLISIKSKRLYTILELFLHFIPALIVDNLARLVGKKPGLFKIARKIRELSLALSYFTLQQWDFENRRVQKLWKRMGPQDKLTFPFAIRNVDWDEHAMKMIKGFREYVIGDRDGNQEEARRRYFRLYIIHTLIRLGFGMLCLWIIWKLCNGCRIVANVGSLGT